ncbi:MAG: MarR family winged helix-turn-helix transcriptional regulator [Acidobacteriota bacterium]|nr:MarR family winged helix-turn-helix transcriptional regulator [Acidobacteriota bacterium]MDH3529170.1 MarR family winged helix-turn-helix transcriptional regulator [Acidobacteriota bacterium]
MYRDDLVSKLEEVALGMRKARTRIFEANGLHSGQARVISALLEYGDLSQADIGRLLDVSGPTTKKLVDNLCDSKLVRLSASGSDKRLNIVSLTKAGRTKAPIVKECNREIGLIASKGMSEPEIIMTGLLLARLSENFKDDADSSA